MRLVLGVTLAMLLLFLGLGLVLPKWILFLLTLALAKGLVVLSVVLLMHAGLVSFGQGLFFATSAYTVGFAMKLLEIQEAVVLAGLGMATSIAVAALTGLLLARYREIFFAMLSLAISMILYGVLLKAYGITGGTDGMGIASPTILGLTPPPDRLRLAMYAFTLVTVTVMISFVHRYADSPLGYTVRAIRDNEVRLEYLGISVQRTIYLTYLLAGGLAGLGGVLVALNVGHIDPQLAYWTTSGEFVFVALLGGTGSVFAPLGGAIIFEFLRTYAFKYSPYTWQMTLGIIMLAIILFMPEGLWTISKVFARSPREWRLSWKRSA
ncbi:MAG: branched-chain amino acid ABC transporter permease [candidate division NC10 bacterium]|nr:branched-chain amino acid ABC transporter permease [candidate division NC10 bacterium]